MDGLALLRLQIEWGADEAIGEAPVSRLRAPPTAAPFARPISQTITAPTIAAPVPIAAPRLTRAGPAAEAARVAAAATDIAALHAAIRGFTLCGLRDTATNTVVSTGPVGADAMVIGEPPGAEEDRGGAVFSGPTGVALDRILHALKMDRAALLLAPLIPWRPPGNRPPTDAELAQCLPFLHRLIVLARPRRIVLLGAQAARALLPAGNGVTLRRVRGRWAELLLPGLAAPIAMLPTYNPAALRTANERREAWSDWRLLHRTLTQT